MSTHPRVVPPFCKAVLQWSKWLNWLGLHTIHRVSGKGRSVRLTRLYLLHFRILLKCPNDKVILSSVVSLLLFFAVPRGKWCHNFYEEVSAPWSGILQDWWIQETGWQYYWMIKIMDKRYSCLSSLRITKCPAMHWFIVFRNRLAVINTLCQCQLFLCWKHESTAAVVQFHSYMIVYSTCTQYPECGY